VGGTVDRFGTSGQFPISGNPFQYITSPRPLPPAEHKLASQPPVYLTTWLQHTTLAVTTQINGELGKCTAS